MQRGIAGEFDRETGAYVVTMTGTISLEMLQTWIRDFSAFLRDRRADYPVPMIMDTGKHDFEELACLACLRRFLSGAVGADAAISRVAFICPAQFRPPEIVSGDEAYFTDMTAAMRWIKNGKQVPTESVGYNHACEN